MEIPDQIFQHSIHLSLQLLALVATTTIIIEIILEVKTGEIDTILMYHKVKKKRNL